MKGKDRNVWILSTVLGGGSVSEGVFLPQPHVCLYLPVPLVSSENEKNGEDQSSGWKDLFLSGSLTLLTRPIKFSRFGGVLVKKTREIYKHINSSHVLKCGDLIFII